MEKTIAKRLLNRIKVVHGESLKVLKSMATASVDVVVTSPPYNTLPIGTKPSGITVRQPGWLTKVQTGYADQRDETEYQQWLHAVVAECMRVSKGLVWINHKIRYRKGVGLHPVAMLPFPVYSEIIWDRMGTIAQNCRRFAPSHEVILGLGRPHHWNRCNDRFQSVWRIAPARGSKHPCPFPLEIPRRLIESSCPPGGTVLDPFTGSGTTGVAAKLLSRKFIGIENDARYVRMTQERIAAA